VNEHGAAAAGDAGFGVVVDFNKQVVEPVVTPKPVSWFTGRPAKGPIIAPIGGIFAPRVRGTDPTYRQWCPGLWDAVGSPPHSHREKLAPRRAAVALTLVGLDPAATQGNRDHARTSAQDALRAAARQRTNPYVAKRNLPHVEMAWSVGNFPTHTCSCIFACSTSRRAAQQNRSHAIWDRLRELGPNHGQFIDADE
jgi:hypothetical protein